MTKGNLISEKWATDKVSLRPAPTSSPQSSQALRQRQWSRCSPTVSLNCGNGAESHRNHGAGSHRAHAGRGKAARNQHPRDWQRPPPRAFQRVLSSSCVWRNYSKSGKSHSKGLKETVFGAHTGTGIMRVPLPGWKPVTHRTLEIILGKILTQ